MDTTTLRPVRVRGAGPHAGRFRAEVLRGLRGPAKELPCKFFYDEIGSWLFEQICELEEYYPTRTELAIMRCHVGAMAARLGRRCLLIEFGSGSSRKTRLLLDHLEGPAAYVPVDISREYLGQSARALASRYPHLDVLPVWADFTEPFGLPPVAGPVARRVVYFPGSTIGNFEPARAGQLLRRIARLGGEGGGLLIGIDLVKDPAVLEAAYNDAKGITAAFNLNLLRRINRELGADFRLGAFEHRAVYNEAFSRIEMHLVSRHPQTVRVGRERFFFEEGENTLTECSYKYRLDGFRELAGAAGLEVEEAWTDARRLFAVLYLSVR